MAAELIDGKKIAEAIHEETRHHVKALKQRGVNPCITFIRVGEDPASQSYVGMKNRKAQELGIKSETVVLSGDTSEEKLLDLISKLNQNTDVHGILVQAPLPDHISETKIFEHVSPQKDVDGFHPENMGKLLLGDTTGFRSCTPAGIHELLIRSDVKIEGAEVVILGRGNIVGKPMAAILCQKQKNANASVTILHSRSRNIAEHTKRADIVIAAMGQTEFLKRDMIKSGAVVIDVGVNRVDDPSNPRGYRLVGDIDFKGICEVASKVTPNPGGVGPMTIAMLMVNTVHAAELQNAEFFED